MSDAIAAGGGAKSLTSMWLPLAIVAVSCCPAGECAGSATGPPPRALNPLPPSRPRARQVTAAAVHVRVMQTGQGWPQSSPITALPFFRKPFPRTSARSSSSSLSTTARSTRCGTPSTTSTSVLALRAAARHAPRTSRLVLGSSQSAAGARAAGARAATPLTADGLYLRRCPRCLCTHTHSRVRYQPTGLP